MKIGCSPAYVFAHFGEKATFDDVIWCAKRAAKLGFKGLQLETYNKRQMNIFTNERIKVISDLFKSLEIESPQFVAHSIKDDLVSLDKKRREAGVKEFEDIVRICERLEIINIITIPSSIPPEVVSEYMETYPGAPPANLSMPEDVLWDKIWRDYVDTIRRCIEVVETPGMKLAIEACPYSIVSNSDSFLRLAKEINSDSLGMNLDTAHLFVQKEPLEIVVEKLGNRLFGTHICDNDGCSDYHWSPGKGKIDWKTVLRSLTKIGYEGFLDLEINQADDSDIAYLEGKNYLEKILKELAK